MSSGALVIGEALIDEVVDGGRITRHRELQPGRIAV